MVKEYARGYIQLFPAHLADDAARMSNGLFTGFWCILSSLGITRGMARLVEKGHFCDVMIQVKE